MTDGALHEVRLIGFPLALYRRAAEHHEELMREFQLLTFDPPSGADVPRRLVELVGELTASYGSVGAGPDEQREAALARGDETIDLTYQVPPAVGAACTALDRMLDEADEFCRAEQLLTLASAPDTAAFRKWYLREFPAQLAGEPPTPWPGVPAAAH